MKPEKLETKLEAMFEQARLTDAAIQEDCAEGLREIFTWLRAREPLTTTDAKEGIGKLTQLVVSLVARTALRKAMRDEANESWFEDAAE